ncbi:pirin-like C-terminal cupin domain-containing protein [Chromatiaceae bacterium AAb-1]|nr:pirin-like C-terminal cupin domain-containing protein [Chromatiaceae bacterium AAb-1]
MKTIHHSARFNDPNISYRTIERVEKLPVLRPGFAGPKHLSAEIIRIGDFVRTDPFFLMMDDRAIGGGPLGGAHPHAGLETVSFVLSGSLSGDGFTLNAGDVEWMTAGSGIVHGDGFDTPAGFRLLQLWIALPPQHGKISPYLQLLRQTEMPVLHESGVTVRLYSGTSGGMVSSTRNIVPVTLADIHLEPGATFKQQLPVSYNGFLIILEGDILAGNTGSSIGMEQIGWLDRPKGSGNSVLELSSTVGARVILFSGEPLHQSLASYGPFIGGSQADILRYSFAYQRGEFPYAKTVLDNLGLSGD